VKIARTSNHIFLRAQVCSTKCAEEWIELQVEKLP
jgi:hypothetical protein